MGTAYLPIIIEVEEGTVSLFDAEAIAEVEYSVSHGELHDWHVSNLKFQKTAARRDASDRLIRVVVGEAWCPDDLRAPLLKRINVSTLESDLTEHLYSEGVLSYAHEATRADLREAAL
jgi:hypothetical protein